MRNENVKNIFFARNRNLSKTKVKRGTYPYWAKSVRRLSVMTGQHPQLPAGKVVDGFLDLGSVLQVYHVFKEFIGQYEGQEERPFTPEQEAEFWRVFRERTVVEGIYYD